MLLDERDLTTIIKTLEFYIASKDFPPFDLTYEKNLLEKLQDEKLKS